MKTVWKLDETVGCSENPGYFGGSGGSIYCVEVCDKYPGITRVSQIGAKESRHYRDERTRKIARSIAGLRTKR